jgi:histidinol dehydrogenase
MIKIMKSSEVSRDEIFARVVPSVNVEDIVADIIANVRKNGDAALYDYSEKFDITRVEVHRMRSCGNIPAEGAESALRAEFIKRYPTAFRKNDRFFGVNISPEDFDTVYNKYFV